MNDEGFCSRVRIADVGTRVNVLYATIPGLGPPRLTVPLRVGPPKTVVKNVERLIPRVRGTSIFVIGVIGRKNVAAAKSATLFGLLNSTRYL